MNTSLELNDGRRMPALGLGTWKSEPGEVGEVVASGKASEISEEYRGLCITLRHPTAKKKKASTNRACP